jgi:plasmid stabilization system protein ParE
MPYLGGVYGFTDERVKDVRVWQARGFENYLIFYVPRGSELLVIRILHGSQDIESIFSNEDPS